MIVIRKKYKTTMRYHQAPFYLLKVKKTTHQGWQKCGATGLSHTVLGILKYTTTVKKIKKVWQFVKRLNIPSDSTALPK